MTTPDLAYLLGRAQLVEARVRSLVAQRRAGDPAPDDPFRGLYVSEETVDQLLATEPPIAHPLDSDARAALEADADAAETAGATLRLRRLARTAGLSPLDIELLLVALLPDLDSRFERLYGYLNDDVTRRRASVGLALAARRRVGHDAPRRGPVSSPADRWFAEVWSWSRTPTGRS